MEISSLKSLSDNYAGINVQTEGGGGGGKGIGVAYEHFLCPLSVRFWPKLLL